jgi:hypothetical protein
MLINNSINMDTEIELDVWTEGYGEIENLSSISGSHDGDMRDDLHRQGVLHIISIMKKYNKTPIVYFRLTETFTSITIDSNFNLYIVKITPAIGYCQHYNRSYDIDITLNNESIYTNITKLTYIYTADGRIAQNTPGIYNRHINEYKISEEWFKQDKLSNFCIDKIKFIFEPISGFFPDSQGRALPIIMKIQSSFIELNKKLRKGAYIISRKITSPPFREDYEKVLSEKDALITSLQSKLSITSAELSEKAEICATLQHNCVAMSRLLQHECQTLSENLQARKEELYKTNSDHEVIITELESKCLELTMTISEKDAIIASLQGISNIISAELSEKDAIIATLQHKCQTLTENLQSSKEELYQTNADHDTIITELECKCLELTMTISEKDAIISQHVVISEEEVELKASSIYYRLYPDYIDSIGNIYKKDNATVPDELLISYIDHMGYSKFVGDNFEIIYSKDKLCLMKHSDSYIINNNLPKIAKKLIKMLKKGAICHRPSFIYTTPRDKLIETDKSLDENTLKKFEYIGPGHREVYYNNGIFKYI